MHNGEIILIEFFQSNPNDCFSRREIVRRAIKRARSEDDDVRWADEALNALVAREFVYQDDAGYYKLKSNDKYDNK